MPKQTGPKGITEARFRASLRKNAAIPSLVARELGCDRSNVVQRIGRSEELQELVRQIEAEALDLADAVIIDALGERDIRGKPTKEARNMARWRRDHELRRSGLQLRVDAGGSGGAPGGATPGGVSVTVSLSYIDAKEDVL